MSASSPDPAATAVPGPVAAESDSATVVLDLVAATPRATRGSGRDESQTAVATPPESAIHPQIKDESQTPAVPASVYALLPVRGSGDDEVLRLATLQRGLVHRRQLRAAGIAKNKLATRVHDGRLTCIHSDVFAVGPMLPQVQYVAETAAALQYVGFGVLSHFSAANLWGMLDSVGLNDLWPHEESVWVTLAGKELRASTGIHLHSVQALDRRDLRRCRNLPVTSPARTILDLAGMLHPSELESLLAQTLQRGLARAAELQDVIVRAPATTPGIARLRRLLNSSVSLADTRSRYERKLKALIAAAELPQPLTNVKLGGYIVDYHWPEQRLVLEFDSWRFHRERDAFERDRLRDQHLIASGQRVMRATAGHVDHTPFALIARLAVALSHDGES